MDDILTADTRHFFIQARGSLAEVIEHLEVALDEKYISEEVYRELNLFVMKSLGLSMDTSNRLTRKRTNFEASQSLIVLIHHTVFHHKLHPSHCLDILYRVAVDSDNISKLSFFYASNNIINTEKIGSVHCC